MSGFVIGKQLGKGFAGNVSRSQDTVIACFAAKGAEIPFGAPVILNADGTVSRYSKGDSAAKVIGFAVREVKQAKDVLLRGSVCVKVAAGTAAPGGAVYLRTGTGTGHTAGDLVASASTTSGETAQLSHVVFASAADSDGIAEATVITRAI